ncbi:LAQU0S11e01002g1_1 [Lachancea quebecensis]|uniref:LAQU0S11e01002g1_1 n=1 Tax=Lachancea quebecensis TaxID=1654605 RepID=A0A0P1KUS0_9SACH|nr:LAQU0S11e01002g1_1 [Lachancea quebecensis]
MDQAKDALSAYYKKLEVAVGESNFKDVHVPSFLLGCFFTVLLLVLEPVFKALVGGILVSVVTVAKYLVIVGGVVLCGMVLTSKGTAKEAPPLEQLVDPRDHFIQSASPDDLNVVGYNEMKTGKRRRKPKSVKNTYETFVRQAGPT